MNEAPGERRGYPRFLVQFSLDFLGQDTSGVGLASTLSTEGCTVEGSLMVQEGWNLELRLLLPDQVLPTKVILAVVRWSEGRRFGVQFLQMGDEEQVRLRRFVITLETHTSH